MMSQRQREKFTIGCVCSEYRRRWSLTVYSWLDDTSEGLGHEADRVYQVKAEPLMGKAEPQGEEEGNENDNDF
jgi:hypothetical protein